MALPAAGSGASTGVLVAFEDVERLVGVRQVTQAAMKENGTAWDSWDVFYFLIDSLLFADPPRAVGGAADAADVLFEAFALLER